MSRGPQIRRRLHRCLLVAVLTIPACRGDAPSRTLQAELHGARAIERTADGALRHWFDAESGPVVRIQQGCAACMARLVGASTTTTLACEQEASWLRCEIGAAPLGRARLEVVDGRGAGAHWPVEVVALPPDATDHRQRTLWDSLATARAASRQGAQPAMQAWADAASQALTLQVPSEAARRLHSAIYFALKADDILAADRFAAMARRHLVSGKARANQRYMEALIALAGSDLRTGAQRLADVARLSELSDHAVLRAEARGYMAVHVLLNTGQLAQAEAELGQLAASAKTPRSKARRVLNHGFALLRLALEDDPERLGAAKARIEEAIALATAHDFGDLLADNYTHLAWACHALKDTACAADALAKARAAQATHTSMFEPAALDLLEGEIQLAAGQLDAAASTFSRRSDDGASEATWRALFGLGRVALRRKDAVKALDRFRQAEAALRRVARNVALRADRGRYLDQRSDLRDAMLDLALARGQTAEAFALADAHQAQVLRSLTTDLRIPSLSAEAKAGWQERVGAWKAAQTAWQAAVAHRAPMTDAERAAHTAKTVKLKEAAEAAFDATAEWLDTQSPDQTPDSASVASVQAALGPDDALIEFIDAGTKWRAFRIDPQQVTVVQVAAGGDPLAAFAPVRGHLYVVTGGRRDLYDLNQRGLSVSFLPHAGFLRRSPAQGAAALVAVDPENDLPFARQDATRVPGAPTPLAGSAVTRAAILEQLPRVGVFHFSGHGVLRERDPWDAHLRLADGRLTLSDILLTRTPGATIVLSGCKTGAPQVLGRRDVVGLPEAFLAAGARSVIATGRDVPDREAAVFVEHFYKSGGAQRPGVGLRAGVAALKAQKMSSWTAWRLIGRPE